MKFIAHGDISSLGWTDDTKSVALRFKSERNEDLIIEFPVDRLPELSVIATQMATKSAERTKTVFDPPCLPVAKWSVGAALETGGIALKFEYPVAGAHGFRIDRETALALHKALGDTLVAKKGAN